MVEPAFGPFLFDTSAEVWLARNVSPGVTAWLNTYLALHPIAVSAITVTERIRGYSLLWRKTEPERRDRIEDARLACLSALGEVLAVDAATGVVAGEIMSLVPDPPTPPQRSHRLAESRHERLARWRFDAFIAATALVSGMPLVHNNPADFGAIRGAIEMAPERFPQLGPLILIRCTTLA